ncbi:MAG: hypothetical protein E6X52_00990 [Actinomyces sp.]|uniref:hypothetical protein n=1 Tax=Actinomyces sp. TaxID=29317 RepID=UPI002804339C|nr:hypothetical protein [Actinomyces sp.]MDU4831107.1 hypothetical protein [Actinomyces sp.]MDU6757667.1 hypothetical protein [Actinomyces sp.]
MITIRDVVDQLQRITGRLEALPQFRWGRVVSLDPLQVVLDGETKPIVGVGTITVPIVGARVLVLLWNRRATILGVARPEPTKTATENTIVVGGVEYQACGVQDVPEFAFAYSSPPVHAGTIEMPYPYTPPEGWRFQYFPMHSSSFTFVQSALHKDSQKVTLVRVAQFFNGSTGFLKKVGWRLTKFS